MEVKEKLEGLLEEWRCSGGKLALEKKETLHKLLRDKYGTGVLIPEYSCPVCGRPLVLGRGGGAACLFSRDGCGYHC
jgi:hypothetical protein